jgi:hypothetical protein
MGMSGPVFVPLLASSLFWPQEAPEPLVHRGVAIVRAFGPEAFPSAWLVGETAAKGEPASPAQADRAAAAVKRALDAYPEPVLADHLRRVQLAGRLEFYGIEFGATNALDTVYLAVRSVEEGFTDRYIESGLHHELSSILLRNRPDLFDRVAWLSCNPPGFRYGAGGTEAVRSGKAGTAFDPALAAQGFLAQYSQASVEEDFNLVVEGLFCGGKEFWGLVDQHERLRRKVRLATSFYSGLHGQFDEGWFRARGMGGDVGDRGASHQ